MQSNVKKVSEVHGSPRPVDRHRIVPVERLSGQMGDHTVSPSQQNGPKRRKLNFFLDKDTGGADFELNPRPPPPLPLQLNLSPQEEDRQKNLTDHSEEDDDGNYDDEAGPSGKLEFRIRNISKICMENVTEDIKLVSPKATIIRCLPWRILFLLRGCQGGSRSVGFFLQCNAECDLPTWTCHARARLTVVAQQPGAESLTKSIDHTFCLKENDWGFSSFISLSELLDPERGLVLPPAADECEGEPLEPPTAEEEDERGVSLSRPLTRSCSSSDILSNGSPSGKYRRSSSLPRNCSTTLSSPIQRRSSPVKKVVQSLERDTLVLRIQVYADAPHGADWDSKKFTGFVGLRNQGATCYMNSLLQALFFTNELRRAVFLMPTESDDASTSIPLALQRVFYELQFNERAVGTKRLTRSFGWESFESLMQHDVQELCRVLLDNMENKMKGTSVEETIPGLFRGKMLSYICCKHVPYESKREENFYDIQLKVKGNRDVYQAFKEYTTVETLSGENKYDAGEYGLQEAEKGVIFTNFPPVLYLQLMRFQYDCITNANIKVNDRFEFPYRLNLDPFLRSTDPDDPATYILHAVLVHSGDNHSGHYVVYINPYGNNRWYKFDDDVVSRSTPREAIDLNYGTSDDERGSLYKSCTSAYMLVYFRESSLPQVLKPVSTADIPDSLLTRLKEERRVEADHRRAKAESHLYACILLVLDEDFYGWQGFDVCDFETLPTRRLNVPKTSTLLEVISIVASHLRTDPSLIRLWRVITRRSGMLRFTPLLPPQKSPVQKPPSPLPTTEGPMAALAALTNSYQHQTKSPSRASRLPASIGDDCTSPPVPLLPASGPMAVWVQTLPPLPHLTSTIFSPWNEVLCFLKYFFPPPANTLTASPFLTNPQMGTLTYVGWIIVQLDAPLNSILPELRSRASLPADDSVLLFEENGLKELRSLTHHLEASTVRVSLGTDDGTETFILVYQQKLQSDEELDAEVRDQEEESMEDSDDPIAEESKPLPSSIPIVSPKRSLILMKRKPITRPRLTAMKLLTRSKRMMRCRSYPVTENRGIRGNFNCSAGVGRKQPTSKASPAVSTPSRSSLYSPFFVKGFYHELLTRVSVEFYELVFPWHMLPGLRCVEPAAAIAFPPPIGERILLPGVPLSGGSGTFKTSLLLEQVISSIQGPAFTGLISPNESYNHLVTLVASHFSAPANCIQLFTVSTGPTMSGEREFSAIPSSLEWKAKDIFVQHSPSPPRHKGNHASTRKLTPSVQIFFQRLSVPTERLERMCQLRCVFVDSRKVREVVRLLLIVPHQWTVSRVLQLAKKELISIGCLSDLGEGNFDSPNEIASSQPLVLRMFETLNTWIIQQYPSDEIAARLQLLENRLLRIEVMPPEEQEFFAAYEGQSDTSLLLSDVEGENLRLPSFPLAPSSITSSSAVSVPTPMGGDRGEDGDEEEDEEEDYDVNIEEEDDEEDEEEEVDTPSNTGRLEDQEEDDEEEVDDGSSSGVADPNNLSLICNADEEEDEAADDENDPLKFIERDSEEEGEMQVPQRLVRSADASVHVSDKAEDETMDSCDRDHDEEAESLGLEISSPSSTPVHDSLAPDETSTLPVVCSLFYRDTGSGAISTGLLPFTMVLRHNEPVSSLLDRIRLHLGLRSEIVEKWRLAVLSGPISPNSATMVPLAPTQESLLRMRSSYKYLTTLAGAEEARVDLAAFMPAPLLRRCGEKKALLFFGLRPWLGIEMPMSPMVPHKGVPATLLSTSNLHPQHPGVGAAKRKSNPSGGKYVLSEKPIRIWN
ncbi:ubiquitin carboxyl terminal hydrolase 7 [Echinococcus multilocularis]|uniref:Ubiquitin carboxyl-terminal hydrolase 7 n=1 Tax=Echinococcus multilocularis TaxID=6211 RepID=A0A068YCQ1_ECHMU|nr:ubiquitin carboxyl terminal hydrolase 7 [Echinococcus multilocularis]